MAGSSDATLALAEKAGCKTITGPGGRGRQMNLGAAQATAEVLLFLHADTLLPDNFPDTRAHRRRPTEFCRRGFFPGH